MPPVILACSIMRTELDEVLRGAIRVEVRYLEQALRRTPHLMTGRVQTGIDAVCSPSTFGSMDFRSWK
ncbi:MAG: hypothetical protein ACLQVJ_06990 [Syntrophobacteraceae bacterium]